MSSSEGAFYIIQLLPAEVPQRIKMGYSTRPQERLKNHRTAAPTAKLLATFPCPRWAERAAIQQLVAHDAEQVGPEVFDLCEPVADFVIRATDTFALWEQEAFQVLKSEMNAVSPFALAFANALHAARLSRGLSRRGLAADSGVALDTVRLVEAAEREPRIGTAVTFLRALGRPAWKFLRDVEEAVYGED